jgi:uncharacterized protein YjaZ
VNRFGAERLRGQVALLTVHEYHHIARARVAPFTTLLDAVVAEGLATACSALSDPGRPLTDYLLFAPGQLDWYTPSRLRRLWAALAADADSKDLRRRAAYLDGGCDGPHGAPSRSGYYLGYLMVHDRLARGDTIADLTRMSTRDIWRDHVRRMKDEG